MAFGLDAGISRNTNNTVQVAEKANQNGDLTDMATYGGKTETSEETYSTTFANTALNGQTGTTDIITAHNLIEQNTDFGREQLNKVSALATQA